MSVPSRPALRWHGGKWVLAPWIIANFPTHRVYVEPFGGGGSVLLRKARAYAEVYNDLDGEAVNLFRILRAPNEAARLIELLRLTPFARAEFEGAYALAEDPVERARRLVIRSFMGFGSDGFNRANKTGFRASSGRSGTTPAHDWANYPGCLAAVVSRLAGVILENKDACAVMAQHDGPSTLHYVDPPYLPETRSMKSSHRFHAYVHEMDEAAHGELLGFLRCLKGIVVLSGYPSALYDVALDGWRRIERKALADGARERTEVLWINRPPARGGTLFGDAA
ncbi:MAG TPA: DNA adenine methylase [Alphaproteobacteria bacterium]|jgi:DNA adenine methylase